MKMKEGQIEIEGTWIVPYCTIGYRSAKFTQAFQAEHPEIRIYNMAGSILAWLHAGGEVVGPQGKPVKAVHVYGAAWDIAPLGYETQRFA